MKTLSAKIEIHIPYSLSLKDKRQVSKSLIGRVKNRFNVSIAEVDTQNILKFLTIGIALVSQNGTHARKMLDEVIRYIENSVEAEIVSIDILDDNY